MSTPRQEAGGGTAARPASNNERVIHSRIHAAIKGEPPGTGKKWRVFVVVASGEKGKIIPIGDRMLLPWDARSRAEGAMVALRFEDGLKDGTNKRN